MKSFINIFRNLLSSYQMYRYNRRNNVWVISEREFNRLVDKHKPVIRINI